MMLLRAVVVSEPSGNMHVATYEEAAWNEIS